MRRPADPILAAAHELVGRAPRLVLAVSGGVDSMTLLDAVARASTSRGELVVATFDHGTGTAARHAVALVRREARARGIRVRAGRASLPQASEAVWRSARLAFLRSVAAEERALLATGHTGDDQLETVVMRVLRGAGLRGLAGLLASGEVARPLLPFSRAEIRSYADARGVPWVEDPTNTSRAHLRNRIRMDLLPAILAATPDFGGEMLALAKKAQRVRVQLDEVASAIAVRSEGATTTRVDLSALECLPDHGARLLWQAVLCSMGTAADWRGTVALSRLARQGRVGARCQISGGIEAVRERTAVAIRRRPFGRVLQPVRLEGDATFDRWRFRRQPEATIRRDVAGPLPADPWMAALPAGSRLTVRSWVPGDRMDVDGEGHARRVKRFFADARIVGPHRAGWPVVLVEDRIVWIPGVRRSPSADRIVSGSSIIYRCERHPG